MSVAQPRFAPPVDRRNALDRAHIGDIRGALGTISAFDTGPRLSSRRKLGTLLAVLGPGLVVMVADNDAGTISVFSQAGQNHGTRLLWVLLFLGPALYVTQEMVARLGAVTGSGHARLTLERFGRFWCALSLSDLLILNLATLITEFIGVELAAGYLGASRYVSVPVAALLLVAVTVSGSFRRWERAMYLMIAANLTLIPLAVLGHPHLASIVGGLRPSFGSGSASSILLLLVALVGTTVAPWQLFFQQSNVIDKRITSRWLSYERADTAIGVILFVVCAGAVMLLSAAASSGTALGGHFTDAGGVARAIGAHLGGLAGFVFAVALLNASLLAASVVSLSGSYAVAEVVGVKHSLHRSWQDARVFHGSFGAIVLLAAGVVMLPHLPLGAVVTLVQALAGILLPSTVVLLLILCNDEELLGPLTNGRWLNAAAGGGVVAMLALSTLLAMTAALPHLSAAPALLATTALLVVAPLAAIVTTAGGPTSALARDGLTPWQRRTWTAPMLERLRPPRNGPRRLVLLGLLRVYIVLIAGLLLLKLTGLLPG